MSVITNIRQSVAHLLRENVAAARDKRQALGRLVQWLAPQPSFFTKKNEPPVQTKITVRNITQRPSPDQAEQKYQAARDWALDFCSQNAKTTNPTPRFVTEVLQQMGKDHPERALMLLENEMDTIREGLETDILESNQDREPDTLTPPEQKKLKMQCAKEWEKFCNNFRTPGIKQKHQTEVLDNLEGAFHQVFQKVVLNTEYPALSQQKE